MEKVYALSKAFAVKKILLTMMFFVLLMTGCSKNDNNDQSDEFPGEYPIDSENPPLGAINGLFTINGNGDQVYFSQGNLQYKPSANTWRFAENQWDLCGNDYHYVNENPMAPMDSIFHVGTVLGGSNYSLLLLSGKIKTIYPTQNKIEWIDAFGWATSGWPCNLYYQPWENRPFVDDIVNNIDSGVGVSEGSLSESVVFDYSVSYGPPVSYQDMTGTYADCDWGVYNAISNGGNIKNMWRTMTRGEWDYLLNFRYTSSGIRYATARIGDVLGIILLPDDWEAIYYPLNSVNRYAYVFFSDVYERNWLDYSDWNILEEHGAVFIPLNIDCRIPSSNGYMHVSLYELGMDYWTASAEGNGRAHTFYDAIQTNGSNAGECRAHKKEVRLVCPVQR